MAQTPPATPAEATYQAAVQNGATDAELAQYLAGLDMHAYALDPHAGGRSRALPGLGAPDHGGGGPGRAGCRAGGAAGRGLAGACRLGALFGSAQRRYWRHADHSLWPVVQTSGSHRQNVQNGGDARGRESRVIMLGETGISALRFLIADLSCLHYVAWAVILCARDPAVRTRRGRAGERGRTS